MPDIWSKSSNFSDDEEWTVTEIAEQLGLNPATARAWIHQDLIPARRDGRRWLIRRSDLDQFLRDNPSFGKAKSSRRSDNLLLGERSPTPTREGTRAYAAGVLERGLTL